jgi:hypothetical protein
MKNLFFLSALVFSLASCTNVSFVNHQPEFLEPLSEIPEKYHGTFLLETDTHTVTIDVIDGMSINSDTIVVKARGNYFYVNILVDNGNYQLYVYKLIRYLDYENSYAVFPIIDSEQTHLFNVIDEWNCNNGKQCYLLDNVNENQFNLLVNSVATKKVELQRIDK